MAARLQISHGGHISSTSRKMDIRRAEASGGREQNSFQVPCDAMSTPRDGQRRCVGSLLLLRSAGGVRK